MFHQGQIINPAAVTQFQSDPKARCLDIIEIVVVIIILFGIVKEVCTALLLLLVLLGSLFVDSGTQEEGRVRNDFADEERRQWYRFPIPCIASQKLKQRHYFFHCQRQDGAHDCIRKNVEIVRQE